jgi:hypothetical protein
MTGGHICSAPLGPRASGSYARTFSPGHRDATSAIAVRALDFLILYELLTHSDEYTR